MKSLLFTSLFFAGNIAASAQSIGINNNAPHSSAILDVKSNTKGMLIPRTSTTSRLAILNPAKGLVLYDTTTSSFWFHSGEDWSPIATGSNGWDLAGNSGTNPANDFIGTTDNQPLRFRLNNIWAGEIHPTSGNVFLGPGSGKSNTTGESNTAMGDHSLFSNTEGNRNTANGKFALNSNTSGSNNTAIGNLALFSNLSGGANTATGYAALYTNTIGMENTAMGESALFSNISGNKNVAIGNYSLYANTIGKNNTASGYGALTSNNNGNDNTATGYQALYSNTNGNDNTANGYEALYSNTNGYANTAIGEGTLYSNTTGSDNTAIGYEALYSNTNGYANTANGEYALHQNTEGNANTANGFEALSMNIFGNNNTANGYQALFSNTSGDENSATGYQALYFNKNGTGNTANGFAALGININGYLNTAIGWKALFNNIDGGLNIAIGNNSGPAPGFTNLINTIGIGNNGSFQHGGSNQVVIGNASMLVIGGKVGWSIISDARVKNTIKEDVKGLDFILKLRPVTYHISNKAITDINGIKESPDFPGKYDGEKVKYSGFLAQEVEQAAKAANYEFSGYDTPKTKSGFYTIKYAEFVVPLVKALQEQQVIIEGLNRQVGLLNAEIPMQTGKQEVMIVRQQELIEELIKQMADMKKEIKLLKK